MSTQLVEQSSEDAVPNLLADEHSNVSLIISGLIDRGFNHEYFWINDESYSRLTKEGHKAWLTRNARLSYPMTNPAVSYVCKNKQISYKYAQRLGVSIPLTYTIDESNSISDEKLNKLLEQYATLVVKPADLAQSNGLSLNLSSISDVRKAIMYAQEFSSSTLIQQQVSGEEARFIVFNGKVKAVMLRQTPKLVGDSVSTVAQLLENENINRLNIKDSAVTYPTLQRELIEGIDSGKILSDGQVLELSRSTLIRGGASVYNIHSSIHSSYIQIVESLAQHLGADFVVVDLMMDDHKTEASKLNYSLIEFNELPSLKLCYSCRDGNHYDILSDLLPLIEQTLKH